MGGVWGGGAKRSRHEEAQKEGIRKMWHQSCMEGAQLKLQLSLG